MRTWPGLSWTSSVKPSLIAAGGGLSILALYAVTAWSWLPFCGLLWMVIGGACTLAGFLVGILYVYDSVRRRDVHVGLMAAALIVPLANVAVLMVCVRLGGWLAEHYGLIRALE